MPKKTERGGTLWDFPTSILSQNSKKMKGDPLVEKNEKSRTMPKNKLKGGPFGLIRYCMLRGKPFWFSSFGQQVQFGVFSEFCRTFGRTILATSGVSKKKTKSHDYNGLFF